MVRYLNLKLEDFEFKANFVSFSRDSAYGRQSYEKRGEDGKPYRTMFLIEDGSLFIFPNSTSSDYFDEKGRYIEKKIPVDEEGKEFTVIPSMYKSTIDLKNTISIQEYFNYSIERTYFLNSESSDELMLLSLECQLLFENNQLLKFPYAYYDTLDRREAILIPKEDKIVVVVGRYAKPEFFKVTEIDYTEEEEQEQEQEDVDEIEFEVW